MDKISHLSQVNNNQAGECVKIRVVVLISANVEWGVIREILPCGDVQLSPFGEWFIIQGDSAFTPQTVTNTLSLGNQATPPPISLSILTQPIIIFHGGWGKIAAAASTQYVIDRWHPELLVNLGTCGGFAGEIARDTIILANRTIVYDIIEQMGDNNAHIAHYTTELNLEWLKEDYPIEVYKALLVSGDRDLLVQEIPLLKSRYQAIAGDWESGAIAWVAARNHVRCLILRGVTDLVGNEGGEAYGNMEFFRLATRRIMIRLVESLPRWIS